MGKDVWKRAVEAATRNVGSRELVAKRLGITRQAIDQWRGAVPPRHVLAIEEMSGFTRYELRPDIYGKEPGPLAQYA